MFTSLITDKQTNKQSNRGQVDNIMSAPACLVWHRHYVYACLSGLAQALKCMHCFNVKWNSVLPQ